MNLSDFKFESRKIADLFFETSLTNKEGTKFICNYRSNQAAPDNVIWDEFVKNKGQFAIEVHSELVEEKGLTKKEN